MRSPSLKPRPGNAGAGHSLPSATTSPSSSFLPAKSTSAGSHHARRTFCTVWQWLSLGDLCWSPHVPLGNPKAAYSEDAGRSNPYPELRLSIIGRVIQYRERNHRDQ